VLDFRERCNTYRIKTNTVLKQETTLDILKNPSHFKKSRFLHQLAFLETGFCRRCSGPDYVNGKDKNLVRELWEYRYDSGVETVLIDVSVFGASVAEAAENTAARQFRDSMNAAELGKLLISAEVMGLEGFFQNRQGQILEVVEREGHFINAVSCLGSLRYLKKLSAILNPGEEASRELFLRPLMERCFKRSVYLIEEGRSAGSDEEKAAAKALGSLHGFSVEEDQFLELQVSFADRVETVLGEGFCNSRFYGALLAVHEKQNRIDIEELARRINARLGSSQDSPGEAASFLAGVFLIGRDVLFSGDEVLKEIDRVVASVDDEAFLALLPTMRSAFTSFLPSETDRLAKMAAKLHGVDSDELLKGELVTQSELALGMRLDGLAAEALAKWF
jgi:hypothetical protein